MAMVSMLLAGLGCPHPTFKLPLPWHVSIAGDAKGPVEDSCLVAVAERTEGLAVLGEPSIDTLHFVGFNEHYVERMMLSLDIAGEYGLLVRRSQLAIDSTELRVVLRWAEKPTDSDRKRARGLVRDVFLRMVDACHITLRGRMREDSE